MELRLASGLVGLLDDVAALARLAAASADDVATATGRATSKAAGVLIDDAAVTPQYVHGLAASRELPIILRITKGSLRNKFLFVLPVLLLLSALLPILLVPILMAGGAYLAYEGAHKIHGKLTGHHAVKGHEPEVVARDEDAVVAGAVRTDLILSAEIMAIALNEVGEVSLVMRAVVLAVVALLITVLVYGVVAVIVKMDDVGLRLVEEGGGLAAVGRRIVAAMPGFLALLATVGVFMMLVVAGHLVAEGLHEFGIDGPYDLAHGATDAVREAAPPLTGLVVWVVDALVAAVYGLLIGLPLVYVVPAVKRLLGRDEAPAAH